MPRAAALFARQLLLAAAERNGRSPREAAGTAIRAPRAELAETGRRRLAVLAVVSAAQFLVTLDLWVVNIALPALQRDFAPAALSEVSWILDVYAIVLAAMLLPASLGLALSVFPARQRGTAVGVWAAIGSVAAGGGPVLGGLLVESSWRWIFLINLPVILAALAAGAAILPRRGG